MADLGRLLGRLIAGGERVVRPGEAGYGAAHGTAPAREAPLDVRPGVGEPIGRDEGLRQARLEAERRAGGRVPLLGLPTEAQSVAGRPFIPGPVGKVHDVAERYMAGRDYGVPPLERFYPLGKERSRGIAQEFERMPLFDPAALPSYNAMAKETLDQYRAARNAGLRLTPVDAAGYPYGANPREVALDVGDRGHMAFFKTEPESGAFGSGGEANIAQNHPLLRQSGEYVGDYPMSYNDLFRVVHDYFGHIKHGFGFRAGGEDMAWRAHAGMYSPEARPAMTSETRGQNSWVNYGPHGDFNRTANAADTIYSPQKVALMPAWTMDDLVKRGLIAAPVVGAGAATLMPGQAEAGTVAARNAIMPPPVNPAATTAAQGVELLRQHYAPHIFDRATYAPLPPPSLASAPTPAPAPMAPALLGRAGPPSGLPPEGPQTAGKVGDPNRDPRVEGIAADLANLASSAIEGPSWAPAMMAAKGIFAPRMLPRPPVTSLVW